MNSDEFEECKDLYIYDDFMAAALDFDDLTIEDYKEFMPVLFEIIPSRSEKDPVEMYENVIEELRKRWTASENLPFHGPWHHGMVAGIIIASLRNNGYDFSEADVMEALKRGLMIPAGACGFHGSCGAGTGLGIAVSIITRSTPFNDEERSQALAASGEAITKIGRFGGPRCCALSTYTTLNLAVKKLQNMDYELPESKLSGRCMGYRLNDQCHKKRCPYYPR